MFSVTATGAPLNYQWYVDGIEFTDETNATLVLPEVTAADVGTYMVTVFNDLGSTNSRPARLTVYPTSILALKYLTNTFAITFTTEPVVIYNVSFVNTLGDTNWVPLVEAEFLIGTGDPETVTDLQATNATRFYRITAD